MKRKGRNWKVTAPAPRRIGFEKGDSHEKENVVFGNVMDHGSHVVCGAGDGAGNAAGAQGLPGFLQNPPQGFLGVGVVALVAVENDLPLIVQQRRLHRGGTNIDARAIDVHVFFAPVECGLWLVGSGQ